MALFFDAAWFKARLAALNLSTDDLARALGLSAQELALVFKDQREVDAREVEILALLLKADPVEIANRCGISTPVPQPRLAEQARIDALERKVALLEARLMALEAQSLLR